MKRCINREIRKMKMKPKYQTIFRPKETAQSIQSEKAKSLKRAELLLKQQTP